MAIFKCSYTDIEGLIEEISLSLKGMAIDVIVGIGYGGIIPAGLLARMLDVKDMEIIKIDGYDKNNELLSKPVVYQYPVKGIFLNKRILIVDDIIDTGRTMSILIDMFQEAQEIYVAALYRRLTAEVSQNPPIYAGCTLTDSTWIEFPWEKYDPVPKQKIPF